MALVNSGDTLRRALRQLYAKTVVGFALLIGAWVYLVLGRPSVLSAVAAFMVLLTGSTVVSVCVLHDANHGAFFRSRRLNLLLGWTVDWFLGFGSYSWRVKHNAHHGYPNVDGYDDDIAQAPFARLAPSQPSRPWYRWQHRYIWIFYALALLRWHLTDLDALKHRQVAGREIPPPRRWDLAGLLAGKALFLAWAFLIPMFFHAWWVVLVAYLCFTITASLLMGIVFQLAHCAEEASFVSGAELRDSRLTWAVHEVESTVDFCQRNSALTWFIGGLNFQIEHHLFPRLPHTVYPAIAPIVARNAAKYGVRYTVHSSLRGAFASHYRHLRAMAHSGVLIEVEMAG
jgi:linoleoyl-CoA desaturase